jgi:hypothetical protein
VSDPDQIRTALQPIAEALAADGYALEIEAVAERLALRIRALDDACADCLVPPAMMATMIRRALGERYVAGQIDLAYP